MLQNRSLPVPDADAAAKRHRVHPAARARRPEGPPRATRTALPDRLRQLKKAVDAGMPFLTGTDTGFAVTPYGEWHAKELRTVRRRSRLLARPPRCAPRPGQCPLHQRGATRSACSKRGAPPISSRGRVAVGRYRLLQDRRRLRAVYLAGKKLRLPDRRYDPRQVTDFALSNWTDLYTQARVAELRRQRPALAAAE